MTGWQVVLVALVVSSEAWSRSAPPWANSKYKTGERIAHDDTDTKTDGRDESFPAADVLIAPPLASDTRKTYFEPNPSYSLSYVTGNNVDMVDETLPQYQAFKTSPSLSSGSKREETKEKLAEYQTFETMARPSLKANRMQSMDPSYAFRYSMQDKMLAQQVDSNGRVSGSYSWMMPDGGTMAFSSKDQNMDPVPSQSRYNNNYLNNKQNFSDRNNLHVPTGQQMRQTNKSSKSHSLRTSDPVSTAGYVMRVLGKDAQWIENSDESGERSGYYSYSSPDGDTILVRYSAGRNGFRVLETQGIPGLAQFG